MVFRVDTRSWGDHGKLDLSSAPAAYKTWRQRALDYLSRDRDFFTRGDVRRLLLLAEKQPDKISPEAAEIGVAAVGLLEPVWQVSDALYHAILRIVADTVTQRSERCQGDSGVELWRRLYMEWRGAAPQNTTIQAEHFQLPPRAASLAALWGHLERWLTLGAEVESSGYDVLEWVKASAILKLLPKDLEAQVVARPELQTYTQRLSWIKAQLAHQRATSPAQAVVVGRADMALGELSGVVDQKEPVLARLEALEQLLKKGKGKSKRQE